MPRAACLVAIALSATTSLSGCGTAMPDLPVGAFVRGDVRAMADIAEYEFREGPAANQALVLNVLGQCELLLGDVESAWRHFGAAAQVMGNWSTSGGEEFAAIVGSESSKTYKGDPYEKAMNAFYLGLCFLWRDQPDNARASFKKGILADGESGDEQFQADFTLLFWLAGRMSLLMGLPVEAHNFFEEARQADRFAGEHGSRSDPDNPLLLHPEFGNLVLLVECGMGPEKFADGSERELARFRPRPHPARRARVTLDGAVMGTTSLLLDVDYQARTRGGTEMEGIRQGKAVLKSATRAAGIGAIWLAAGDSSDSGSRDKLLAGLGLLLVSALTQAEADVRHWPTLPSTVQAMALDVTPGAHYLVLEFLDQGGAALPELTQHWTVEVPAGGESYYFFRSLPGLDRPTQERS